MKKVIYVISILFLLVSCTDDRQEMNLKFGNDSNIALLYDEDGNKYIAKHNFVHSYFLYPIKDNKCNYKIICENK